MAERGHFVDVWHFGQWPADTLEFRDRLENAGVTCIRLGEPLNSFQLISRYPSESPGGRQADVVHIHGVFHPSNIQFARGLHVPYVVSPHGGYARGSLNYHRYRKMVFGWLLERPMLLRAAAVFALTEAEAEEVGAFASGVKVCIAPNGVDLPESVDATAFRAGLGIAPGERLAVYAGRLDVPGKRLDKLVRAVAASDGWRLVLIGGDFRGGSEAIRTLIGNLNAAGKVHLLGPCRGKALNEALAGADIFALMSRSEGMPMALLEAAAHGVPSLVSHEVEEATGVARAGGGWVASADAVDSALDYIREVGIKELDTVKSGARSYAEARSWTLAAQDHERAYHSVLGKT
jgi:glycosyltransferase involved in cell wall biosynthesis